MSDTTITINMDFLKSANLVLWKLVTPYLNISQTFGGMVAVDVTGLPVDIRDRLVRWVERTGSVDVMESALQDSQRDADGRAARARLDQWAANGDGDGNFLEPSDYNAALIRNWINENGSYYSSDNIDRAVGALTNRLKWLQLEPVAPPSAPPAPAGEQLQPWQLRLDCSERDMKRASKEAVYDLLKRRRAATGQNFRDNSARYAGNFGSQF